MTQREHGKVAAKTFVVATNPCYERLCRTSVARLGRGSRDRFHLVSFRSWTTTPRTPASAARLTYFVSRLTDISEETAKQTKAAPGARYLLFSAGMPIEALATRLARLDIRDEKRLHLAHEQGDDEVFPVIHRLLRGVAQSDDQSLIVDAWIEGDNLVVIAPAYQRLVVPLERLTPFIGDNPAQARSFRIDEDGSFLYWKRGDVHMGWEHLLQLVDPVAALAAKQKTAQFNRRYGQAIRALRVERDISQAAVEGLTDRHLRRIEKGQQAATLASLQSLATAHGMPLPSYLNELTHHLK
jgi:hypothetical protein